MADVKISNLPASTTPLAGTEVLPIVQSGVTKQVSVANLTAGRDVGANSFSSAAGTVSTPAITTTGDTNTGMFFPAADTVAVSTAGTERMRIDSAGRIGVGTSTLTGYGIRTAQNITGAVISQGIGLTATVQSDVTTSARGVWSNLGTQATAFTLSNLVHFYSQQGTIGAGSTVTNQFGFAADSGLTGATNNYGFHSSIASGTGRWNFYAAGTADNYFAGVTSIGTANDQVKLSGGYSGANSAVYIGAPVSGGRFALNYDRASGLTTFLSGTIASPVTVGAINTSGTWSLGAAPGAESLRVTPVASAVNYLNAQGAVTTGAPSISAAGSDTNIDLTLTPKGTGVLRFGTYTAGILAQAGYITIKDAAGNTRNLLVG